jgi:glycosyltransferase involved in cell wall biosynthesis
MPSYPSNISFSPRLLYACANLPWPIDSGHKIVSYNDIKHLSKCFSIDLISFNDSATYRHQLEYLGILKNDFPNVNFIKPVEHSLHKGSGHIEKVISYVKSMHGGYPYIVSKYFNAIYLSKLIKLLKLKKYYGIFIESTPLGFIIPELDKQNLAGSVTVIFRPHDCLSETLYLYSKQSRNKLIQKAVTIDAKKCQKFEEMLWNRANIILPVTKRLVSMIGSLNYEVKKKTHYFPVTLGGPQARNKKSKKNHLNILYIGTIHYPPNFVGINWFLKNSWPLIKKKYSNVQFTIAGRGGTELKIDDKQIKILDYVEDLKPLYDNADIFIVPLFSGSGIRLKILNAMKHGVPVVSTTTGYIGLEVNPQKELLVGDTPYEFTEKILYLLSNSQLRTHIINQGYIFLDKYHREDIANDVITDIYTDALKVFDKIK